MIGSTMQIKERKNGRNEQGQAMVDNWVSRVYSENGLVCKMIGGIILEACANVDEAIALLKEIHHRTLFNYILLDPNGETYVVETSPRKVAARKSNISTNHFEVLTEENRYRMDDSLRRTKEMERKQRDDLEVYAAYRLLNDKEGDIFSSKYDASAGTIHTAAYLPKEMKAWFTIGGNRMPVIFDFNRYLKGERMNIKKVRGVLNFHTPFVNMDRSYD